MIRYGTTAKACKAENDLRMTIFLHFFVVCVEKPQTIQEERDTNKKKRERDKYIHIS